MANELVPQVMAELSQDRIDREALRAKYPDLSDVQFGIIFQKARDRLAAEHGVVLMLSKTERGVLEPASTKEQKEGKARRHRRKAVRSLSRSVATLDSILQHDGLEPSHRRAVEARRNKDADLSLDVSTRQRRAARLTSPEG